MLPIIPHILQENIFVNGPVALTLIFNLRYVLFLGQNYCLISHQILLNEKTQQQ